MNLLIVDYTAIVQKISKFGNENLHNNASVINTYSTNYIVLELARDINTSRMTVSRLLKAFVKVKYYTNCYHKN